MMAARLTESFDADGAGRTFTPEEARTLLRECFGLFAAGLRKAARTSSETASDLFEGKALISENEELDFLIKREEWVHRFVEALEGLLEGRLTGKRRQGRRPDVDVSLSTLRVLNAFDQEKQAALTLAARILHRSARQELDPLDLRIGVLVDEPLTRDVDNPFGPDYIVDALGVSARALFPNPRLWRPFMERVLGDITPAVPKTYITLNRLLADRGVLPEIKAALRARSELRPVNDKDLLPLFSRLLHEAGDSIESINVEVPPILGAAPASVMGVPAAARGAPPVGLGTLGAGATETSPAMDASAASGTGMPPTSNAIAPGEPPLEGPVLDVALPPSPPAVTQAAVRATASIWPATAPVASPSHGAAEANAFPSLDLTLTLGSSSPVFAVLEQWQSFDPQNEATRRELDARGIDTRILPLNRIPYIRVAMGEQAVSATDKITMDVISLLFDYIFRDPSIPASTRGIFGRLQVPILKAALLERGFFSDRKHPARRFLDRLAAAAIGANTDQAYRAAFEAVAARVVDAVCRDFQLDVDVFERADAELRTFVEGEQQRTAQALGGDVQTALAAEALETDRAHTRALIRDRLAGLVLPFDVRSFADTVWVDYLALLRKREGPQGATYRAALQTLDDLLWSITAKERTAQKARLTKMVPGIIGGLRQGCTGLDLPADRAKTFFDTLYKLHIAAIKPRSNRAAAKMAIATPVAAAGTRLATAGTPSGTPAGTSAVAGDARPAGASSLADVADEDFTVGDGGFGGTNNVHDYVSEMVVGTWLALRASSGESVNARLGWISPLRTKYIFTSRSRNRAFVFSPEELAWQLEAGNAQLLVEPVPLFDRAVSAALDSIAAHKGDASPATPLAVAS